MIAIGRQPRLQIGKQLARASKTEPHPTRINSKNNEIIVTLRADNSEYDFGHGSAFNSAI